MSPSISRTSDAARRKRRHRSQSATAHQKTLSFSPTVIILPAFMEFQHCYARHAPFNPQDSWMMYHWDGKTKGVVWMSDPAEPRPPEGWSRITARLEPIRARIEQQKQEPHAPPHPRVR